MKGYIRSIIILFLLCNNILNTMEEEREEVSPSEFVGSESEVPDTESRRGSESSGTEAANFTRDIIGVSREIFGNLLERSFKTEVKEEDLQRAVDYGLTLYDRDREHYNILLRVSGTEHEEEERRQCFATLKEQILKEMNTTQGQSTAQSSVSDNKKWPKRLIITATMCGIGIGCFIAGTAAVITAWQVTNLFE